MSEDNNRKKFKLGFTIGRFQPLHIGHEKIIDLGLEYCEKFVVLVGSSDEYGTEENPFTFAERKKLINTVYGDKVTVLPIVNIGIGYVPEWGNYLVNTIKLFFGEEPDFYIGGRENNRDNWLSNFPNITKVELSRNILPISGTLVRHDLLKNGTTTLLNEKISKEQIDQLKTILYDIDRSGERNDI